MLVEGKKGYQIIAQGRSSLVSGVSATNVAKIFTNSQALRALHTACAGSQWGLFATIEMLAGRAGGVSSCS